MNEGQKKYNPNCCCLTQHLLEVNGFHMQIKQARQKLDFCTAEMKKRLVSMSESFILELIMDQNFSMFLYRREVRQQFCLAIRQGKGVNFADGIVKRLGPIVARENDISRKDFLSDIIVFLSRNEGDPSKTLIGGCSSWLELVKSQYRERARFMYQTIQDAQGNMSKAARSLGILRQTLMQNIGTLRKKGLWPYD